VGIEHLRHRSLLRGICDTTRDTRSAAAHPHSIFIRPCEPALVAYPPAGPGWLHEIKHDGFRILARKQDERVRIWSRRGADFADRFQRIDGAVRGVNGKIEDKDALRASMRKAQFDSVRGKFKFNNNHYPIQDLFIMEVKKDEKGNLTSALKEIAITDWQDPLHTQCPMKW